MKALHDPEDVLVRQEKVQLLKDQAPKSQKTRGREFHLTGIAPVFCSIALLSEQVIQGARYHANMLKSPHQPGKNPWLLHIPEPCLKELPGQLISDYLNRVRKIQQIFPLPLFGAASPQRAAPDQ